MQTPSKVVEISPARGRDERSLKWIAMACVIVYLVSLGSIFGMAMMAVQASKEVHVDSESGALVGAGTGQPVAVDPITDFQINLSYELPFLSMTYLANVASLEFKYVDANNIILPAAYQIHAVRKTAEGRATFLTAVGDKITVDGSNGAAFLESDGVSHMIIVDDGRSAAMDKGYVYGENAKRHDAIADPHAAVYDGDGYERGVPPSFEEWLEKEVFHSVSAECLALEAAKEPNVPKAKADAKKFVAAIASKEAYDWRHAPRPPAYDFTFGLTFKKDVIQHAKCKGDRC